jgi:hypothetical protein
MIRLWIYTGHIELILVALLRVIEPLSLLRIHVLLHSGWIDGELSLRGLLSARDRLLSVVLNLEAIDRLRLVEGLLITEPDKIRQVFWPTSSTIYERCGVLAAIRWVVAHTHLLMMRWANLGCQVH